MILKDFNHYFSRMKLRVEFFLILFMIFLLISTIVCFYEKSTDAVYFSSISEDEQSNKEVHADFVGQVVFCFK